jgi:hypothetical protein
MDIDIRTRRLQSLRSALPAVYGVVGTLFVLAVAGDLRYFYAEAPLGWYTLWLVTTFGSLIAGGLLLSARRWKPFNLVERRGPAMAYLLVGLINLLGLAIYAQVTVWDTAFFCAPLAYAIGLMAVFARVYVIEDRNKAETFP